MGNVSREFTTDEDDATYGSLTSIGNQSIHRSGVIDKLYKTNLKPSTIQQFPPQKKRGYFVFSICPLFFSGCHAFFSLTKCLIYCIIIIPFICSF